MKSRNLTLLNLSFCALSFAASCGDDDGSTAPESDANAVGAYECDPVGANAEVGALLNAQVQSDVEVINKTPNHPGDPGPLDLP